jgi:hypothetical protein
MPVEAPAGRRLRAVGFVSARGHAIKNNDIVQLLGDNAAYLFDHTCRTVPKNMLHLPGPDFVDRVRAAPASPAARAPIRPAGRRRWR